MFAGSTEHGAWSKEVMSVQDVQIKRYQCTLGVLVVSGWARAHPLNSITQTERVSTCLDVLRKAPTDSHQLRASQKIELTVGRSDRKRAQWRSLSAQKLEVRRLGGASASCSRARPVEGGRPASALGPIGAKSRLFSEMGDTNLYGLISQAPEISCRREGGSRFTAVPLAPKIKAVSRHSQQFVHV